MPPRQRNFVFPLFVSIINIDILNTYTGGSFINTQFFFKLVYIYKWWDALKNDASIDAGISSRTPHKSQPVMICRNFFSKSNRYKSCSQQLRPFKISKKSLKKEAQVSPKKILIQNLIIQQVIFQTIVTTVKESFLQ